MKKEEIKKLKFTMSKKEIDKRYKFFVKNFMKKIDHEVKTQGSQTHKDIHCFLLVPDAYDNLFEIIWFYKKNNELDNKIFYVYGSGENYDTISIGIKTTPLYIGKDIHKKNFEGKWLEPTYKYTT